MAESKKAFEMGMSGFMVLYTLWFALLSGFVVDDIGQYLILVGIAIFSLLATGVTIYLVANRYYKK